jgi:hypothetical protein
MQQVLLSPSQILKQSTDVKMKYKLSDGTNIHKAEHYCAQGTIMHYLGWDGNFQDKAQTEKYYWQMANMTNRYGKRIVDIPLAWQNNGTDMSFKELGEWIDEPWTGDG